MQTANHSESMRLQQSIGKALEFLRRTTRTPVMPLQVPLPGPALSPPLPGAHSEHKPALEVVTRVAPPIIPKLTLTPVVYSPQERQASIGGMLFLKDLELMERAIGTKQQSRKWPQTSDCNSKSPTENRAKQKKNWCRDSSFNKYSTNNSIYCK